ncbi:MAG: hypothetical protein KJP00_07455 [Bacteroidia bacterium]|nr:hypothetical protein [Bacteroidia bacterium]
MAKKNILDVILKTINSVQQKNQQDPNVETADPTVFDLIRGKLQNLDAKSRDKRIAKGKSPESIFDLIKREIEGARTENQQNPNVKTAPGSIFDDILKKINKKPAKQALSGIRAIIRNYNIDITGVPPQVLQQVQNKYAADKQKFDQQYAQALVDLTHRY